MMRQLHEAHHTITAHRHASMKFPTLNSTCQTCTLGNTCVKSFQHAWAILIALSVQARLPTPQNTKQGSINATHPLIAAIKAALLRPVTGRHCPANASTPALHTPLPQSAHCRSCCCLCRSRSSVLVVSSAGGTWMSSVTAAICCLVVSTTLSMCPAVTPVA